MQIRHYYLIFLGLLFSSWLSLSSCQYCWIVNVTATGVPQPNSTCSAYCFCDQIACDPTTGNCFLGCQPNYFGPACNKRRGEFRNAPTVVSACNGVTISWNPLNLSGMDFGEPPASSYLNYRVYYRNGTINSYFNLLSSSNVLSLTLPLSYFIKQYTYEFAVMPLYTSSLTYLEDGVVRNFSTPIRPYCLDMPTTINNTLVNDSLTIFWSMSSVDAVKTVITYQAVGIGDCFTYTNSNVSLQEVPFLSGTTSLTLSSLWNVYKVTLQLKDIFNQTGPVYTFSPIISRESIPVGAPQNLAVISVNESSVQFTWNPPECNSRRGYLRVYLATVTGTLSNGILSVGLIDTTIFSGPVIARGLQPGVLYIIKVAYANSIGAGPEATLQITTPGQSTSTTMSTPITATTAPGAPRNVKVLETTIFSVLISWDPPAERSGNVLSYLLQYWRIISSISTINVPKNTLSWSVTNLDSAVAYTFQVAAIYNDSGQGPFSLSVLATTKVIANAPRNIVLNNSNSLPPSTVVSLTWNIPPNTTGLVSYLITNGTLVGNVSGSVTSCSLTGLKPATYYKLNVAAFYLDGTIMTSDQTVDFWTASSPFTENTIPVPSIVTTGDTYVDVRIFPITSYDSPVSQYGLIYYSASALSRRRRAAPETDLASVIRVPASSVLAYRILGNPSSASVLRLGSNTSLSGSLSNPPLQPGSSYKIVAFAVSTAGGYSVNGTSLPISFTTSTLVNGGVIAAIILFILLILILIALLIWFIWRRFHKETFSNVYIDKEIPVSKSEYPSFMYEPKFFPNWSAIHELHEPRRLILDVSYGSSDKRLYDIIHRKMLSGVSFEEEYKRLPEEPFSSPRKGLERLNRHKNMSPHDPSLLPYDKSRVTLQRIFPDPGTDYINASFINGYIKRRTYIVAQNPFNKETAEDFWLMIYQQNVAQVVMLGESEELGQLMCYIYWPDDQTDGAGEGVNSYVSWYGQIGIVLHHTSQYTHYTFRELKITSKNSYSSSNWNVDSNIFKTVLHYQFHSWPMSSRRESVPDSTLPFLELHSRVRVDTKQEDGPLLVHCRTGNTRSAVFIAFDILLQQAVRENQVNVYTVCRQLRKERQLMVASPELYMFIYDMLGEAILATHFLVNLDVSHAYKMITAPNSMTKRTFLDEQHSLLERYTPHPQSVIMSHESMQELHTRCPYFVPNDQYRVLLHSNNTINATWVDGHVEANQYILTETPSKEKVIDFWSIIQEYNISCVVDMEPSCYGEDGAVPYTPYKIGERHVYGSNTVTVKDIESYDEGTVRVKHLKVRSLSSGRERFVYQYIFLDNWEHYEKTPVSCHALVSLVNHVKTDDRRGPLLIHCLNGANRSGLFVITHLCICKLDMDHYVDVFHTIKSVKIRRSHVLAYLEQHKLLYKALWRWVTLYKQKALQTELQEGTLVGHFRPNILESSYTYAKAAYLHQHQLDDLDCLSWSGLGGTLHEQAFIHYSYVENEINMV